MAMIDESSQSSQPHMATFKENKPLHTITEDTISLDEDERLEEDERMMLSVSQHTEVFESSSEEEDSCSCSAQEDDINDSIHGSLHYSDRTRRVTFASMASKYLIISRGEYSRNEIEETWWTPNQRDIINKTHNRTVDMLEAGLKEKKSAPYRGLEKIAIDGYHKMVQAKNNYVDAVMDEQQRQWSEGDLDLDWEIIASLTQHISRRSTQEALMYALYDENEAREAYQTVKVKDLFEMSLSDVSGVSGVDSEMDHLEGSALLDNCDDFLSDDEDVDDKLIRQDSSIRITKARGLKSPKKSKKKKRKSSSKKKKKKTKLKKQNEGPSQSEVYDEEGDPSESEVDLLFRDFADALGESTRTEGEEEQSGEEAKGKKKRSSSKSSKKKSKSKSKNGSSGSCSSNKKKKKKDPKKESLNLAISHPNDSTDDGFWSLNSASLLDSKLTTTKKKKSKKVPAGAPDNGALKSKGDRSPTKKSPVTQLAATCLRHMRASAA
ncbi:MAG: hypothetical protein SGBAC_005038 [Bacillariaceae sp.]